MKKTYTKKQITEAIAYWKKQLKKLNEDSNNIELILDCNMELPYKNGRYNGDYTPEQFEKLLDRKSSKYDVQATAKIPGESAAAATVTVSGPYENVKAFVNDFYFDGTMKSIDWQEIESMAY